MLSKTLDYVELHIVVYSLAISTNYRLRRKGPGRSGSAILPTSVIGGVR